VRAWGEEQRGDEPRGGAYGRRVGYVVERRTTHPPEQKIPGPAPSVNDPGRRRGLEASNRRRRDGHTNGHCSLRSETRRRAPRSADPGARSDVFGADRAGGGGGARGCGGAPAASGASLVVGRRRPRGRRVARVPVHRGVGGTESVRAAVPLLGERAARRGRAPTRRASTASASASALGGAEEVARERGRRARCAVRGGDADGGCSSRGGADADAGEGRVGGVASTRAPARDRRGADGRARGDGSWRGRARRSGGRRGGGAERRRRGSGSGSVFVGRRSSRRRIRSLGRRRRSVGGGRGNGRTESAAVVRNARVGGVAAPQSAAAGVDSLL